MSESAKKPNDALTFAAITAIGVVLTGVSWWLRTEEGRYFMAAAILGPICIALGLVALIAPSASAKGALAAFRRAAAWIVFGLGVVLGVGNLVLMTGWLRF